MGYFSEGFTRLSITHFCDASCNIRLIDSSIYSISGNTSVTGKALTVQTNGDMLPVIKAIDSGSRGDVIVISSNDNRCAIAGEIFTTASIEKGIAGIIIDGYCRDIDAIQSLGIPFYAKGCCPIAGTKNNVGQIGKPISCGGVIIHPGDIIFGDCNGLIVMSPEEYDNLLPLANDIMLKETRAIEKLKTGIPVSEVFNFKEHYDNVAKNQPSVLQLV